MVELKSNFDEDLMSEFEKIAMKKPILKSLLSKKEKTTEGESTEIVEAEATDVTDATETNEPEKKKLDLELVKEAGKVAAVGIGAAVAGIPGAITELTAVSIGNGIDKAQTHKKIKDQQYRALSVILYIDGLQEVLEG